LDISIPGNTFVFMIKQLTHEETPFHTHGVQISVVCDNISSPANLGMIFRVCEAMGVEALYICGEEYIPSKKMQRAARSTAATVPHYYVPSATNCIRKLKSEAYHILAMELTNSCIDLRSYVFKQDVKYVLVAGAENGGVSDDVLQLVDNSVAIPLFGKNSSMNVATALSICLFECIRQQDQNPTGL